MNQRDQLLENFEDAFMALFMANIAEHEGKGFLEENERLKNDADFKVPPELDRRCLRTINRVDRRKRTLYTGTKVYRVFSKFSVAAVIPLVLFTSAYAAFPAVRVSTLNLLIEVSDIATELTFGDSDDANNEADSIETPSDSAPEDALTIAGYVIPESITSKYELFDESTSQFFSWASLRSGDGSTISIDIQVGEGRAVNINTEDADSVQEVNMGHFEGIIVQHNAAVIVGVADTDKLNFIVITFTDIDFESAINMTNDFISVN